MLLSAAQDSHLNIRERLADLNEPVASRSCIVGWLHLRCHTQLRALCAASAQHWRMSSGPSLKSSQGADRLLHSLVGRRSPLRKDLAVVFVVREADATKHELRPLKLVPDDHTATDA